jgi:hypothetical protein
MKGTAHQMLFRSSNHEGQAGRGMWQVEGFAGRPQGRISFGEDNWITLKFILEKSKGMACTAFMWLRIRTHGGLL